MADDDDNPPEPSPPRPRSSRSSTAASRAGKRRVTLPSSDSSPTASSKSSSGGGGRRKTPATPRPFYRKAGFWLLVIVAEAVAALVISYNTPSEVEDLSIEGGDLAAFCERVTKLSDAAGAPERLQLETAPAFYERQAADFRGLAEVSPDSIEAELHALASLSDEVKVAAEGIAERKRSDATYQTGLEDLAAREGEFEGRVIGPRDQVRKVVLGACGIDLDNPPAPTTTAPSGSAGSAPGTVPASVPPTTVVAPGDGSSVPTSSTPSER